MKSITVAQLIAKLQNEDPDAQVVLAYDFGDYSHTQAVSPICTVQEATLCETGYSRSGWAVETPDTDEEGNDCLDPNRKTLRRLVLSSSRL